MIATWVAIALAIVNLVLLNVLVRGRRHQDRALLRLDNVSASSRPHGRTVRVIPTRDPVIINSKDQR